MQPTALRRAAASLRSSYTVSPLQSAVALSLALLLVLATMGTTTARPAHAAQITTGTVTGTVYFNKLETKDLKGTGPAVAVCGSLAKIPSPVGALAAGGCTASIAGLAIQATRADNRGMCAKIKFTLPSRRIPPAWWPDIYAGRYCT